jgi:hypothetical protein
VVIGNRTRQGRERGVWEGIVPRSVKEGLIKTRQDRVFLLIRPSIQPIGEGKLEPANVPDQAIKGRSKVSVKIIVVLLIWITDEVV